MRGLRLNEIPTVLAFYDQTRWPEEGGPTYSGHFLPDLWAQGWRMENQAGPLQDSFRKVAREFHRDENDIAAKYVVFAANSFLLNAQKTLANGGTQRALIEDAVRRSGIVESYEFLGDVENKAQNFVPPKYLRPDDA